FCLECLDVDGDTMSATERQDAIARELGAAVADDDAAFAELLPELLCGGNQTWAFGRGLASACADPGATWARLVEELDQIAPEERDIEVLRGLLVELWEQDRNLVQRFQDRGVEQPALQTFHPALHSAQDLDERGVERLKQALSRGQVPVWMYRHLAVGRTMDHLGGGILKEMLLLISDQPDGFTVALELLFMRIFSDRSARREHDPELLEAG